MSYIPNPKLVGAKYVFTDGKSLSVRQIKRRDEDQYWVTYETVIGPGLPVKYVMEYMEFMNTFGHLFKDL